MWILYSWKTDSRLIKEVDGVVCLPGARIEHVTERVQHITGRGTEWSILVHIRTNNADKEEEEEEECFYLKSNKMVNTTLANSLLRRLHTQYVQHNIQYLQQIYK